MQKVVSSILIASNNKATCHNVAGCFLYAYWLMGNGTKRRETAAHKAISRQKNQWFCYSTSCRAA